MSTTTTLPPRLASGDIGSSDSKPQKHRRRSHRLSLIDWRGNSVPASSITHVDVFLGSLTDISEQLASSLAESATQRGAEVTLQSLEEFKPELYIDRSSTLRSSSRLAIFVVSTHVAGKSSPNAENFLQWLREASTKVYSSIEPIDPINPNEGNEYRLPEASAPPKSSFPNSSLHNLQFTPSRPQRGHRHSSLTDTLINFGANWRRSFRSRATTTPNKTEGILQGFQYAVFGVGNSRYHTCNATAKYIDSRLQELGGVRVCHVGLGDVSKDIEGVFVKWEYRLMQTVSSAPNSNSTDADTPELRPKAALPNVTGIAGISISEEPAKSFHGPSLADLELPSAVVSRHDHKLRHRRYSSATTILRNQKIGRTFDPSGSMPPLTDHFR
ncbi:NADPH-cytochrome P450 reductase [Phytophthora megakarya]|uniref:NADPH-cytochrome P450 reductase n=1 Tax=Phytophthora megakarya TaxID=4795 RepID=A0A225VY21_9STRA|nr:NADPH-cytochrome P450 reductase [Phytophthora megakarya]